MRDFLRLRDRIRHDLDHRPGYCREAVRDLMDASHLLGLADAHGRYYRWQDVMREGDRRGAEAARLKALAEEIVSRCGYGAH